MNSNLILFDGISGSGKGSRLACLTDFLRKDSGKNVFAFSEPFYLREEIKEFRKNPDRDPRKELELFVKSRKRGLLDYEDKIGEKDTMVVGIEVLFLPWFISLCREFLLKK